MARSALKTIYHIYAFHEEKTESRKIDHVYAFHEEKTESRKIDMGHTTVYMGMEYTRKYNRIGYKEVAN